MKYRDSSGGKMDRGWLIASFDIYILCMYNPFIITIETTYRNLSFRLKMETSRHESRQLWIKKWNCAKSILIRFCSFSCLGLRKKENLINFYPRLNFMKSLNLQFKYLEYCVFNVLILHILYVKLQASGESGENSHLYRAFGVLSSGRRKD